MMRRVLGFVVATLAVANLGLFGMATRASALTFYSYETCGCRMSAGGGQEVVCISFLDDSCALGEETCSPCNQT